VNWISVKERLPEPGQIVLICYRVGKNQDIQAIDLTKFSFGQFLGHRSNVVTHWMPLPEPPGKETP